MVCGGGLVFMWVCGDGLVSGGGLVCGDGLVCGGGLVFVDRFVVVGWLMCCLVMNGFFSL